MLFFCTELTRFLCVFLDRKAETFWSSPPGGCQLIEKNLETFKISSIWALNHWIYFSVKMCVSSQDEKFSEYLVQNSVFLWRKVSPTLLLVRKSYKRADWGTGWMLTRAGPHLVLGGVDTQRPAFERAENVFLVASLNQKQVLLVFIYLIMHIHTHTFLNWFILEICLPCNEKPYRYRRWPHVELQPGVQKLGLPIMAHSLTNCTTRMYSVFPLLTALVLQGWVLRD